MDNAKMTIRDVQLDLRERGLRVSQDTISRGIRCGEFPFGTVMGVGVRRTSFLILRKKYEDWANEFVPRSK